MTHPLDGNSSLAVVPLHIHIPFYCVISGIGSMLTVFILKMPALDLVSVAQTLEWVFYILIPNFCLTQGIQDIYNNYQNKKICSAYDFATICKVLANVRNGTNPCCPGQFLPMLQCYSWANHDMVHFPFITNKIEISMGHSL